MGHFSDREIAYLHEQRLGRLATLGRDGTPHVVPVGFVFDEASGTIHVGSREDSSKTKKFRDAAKHAEVAFLVDDVLSWDPPTPRGTEIRGIAEALREGGEEIGVKLGFGPFQPAWIRITPARIVSWGIDGGTLAPPNARNV